MRALDFFIVLVIVLEISLAWFWTKEKPKPKEVKVIKEEPQAKFRADIVPERMTVSTKKERFFYLMLPSIKKVHQQWHERFERLSADLNSSEHAQEIDALKRLYNAQNEEELLASLKPHPPSITIAQAAMESAWATSRFFRKANNVFGVWSTSKDQARIAANEQRENNTTIWLRKFENIDDAVGEYYEMLARSPVYGEFRLARLYSNNAYDIVSHLDRYSELGEIYTAELAKLIYYNRLRDFDKTLPFSNYP